jgi:hypothetical protein
MCRQSLKFCALKTSIALSAICFIICATVPSSLQAKVEPTIDDMVRIDANAQKSNSDLFKMWSNGLDPNSPIVKSSAYIWQVTNPNQVLLGSSPILQERGPYVARRVDEKRKIVFGITNGLETISYETRTYWLPLPEGESLDDTILTWNPVFLALRDGPLSFAYKANMTDRQRLFVTLKAGDFLRGFSDPLLTQLHSMIPVVPDMWAGPWTNTSWSPVTMYVGAPNNDPWNRQTRVPVPISPTRWNSQYSLANVIQGTDGMMFARPFLDKPIPLTVWSNELGRAIEFVYNTTESVGGINVRRYLLSSKTLVSASILPENADVYQFGPSGLANLTSVVGVQVFASKPHFLDGDTSLFMPGILPNVNKHNSWLDVEPMTGTTLRAQKALQLVYQIRPVNATTQIWCPLVSDRFVPSYWISETAVAPDNMLDALKTGFTQIAAIPILYKATLSFGIIFGLVSLSLAFLIWKTLPESAYRVQVKSAP